MKSLGRKIACESPNLQEGSIELRNAHTNLMNIALVLCLAHVTNTMGQAGDDFEKGMPTARGMRLRCLRTSSTHSGRFPRQASNFLNFAC